MNFQCIFLSFSSQCFLPSISLDIQCFCLFWAQDITMVEKPKIERELTKLLANKQTVLFHLIFFFLLELLFFRMKPPINWFGSCKSTVCGSFESPTLHIDERQRRREKVHKKEIVKRFKSLRRRKTERWMKSIHDYKRQIRFFCYTFRIDGHKQIINIFFGVLRITLALIHKSAYIKSKFSPFLFSLSFCFWPFVSEQRVDTFRVHIT